MPRHVLVLGASGQLGSAIARVLSSDDGFTVRATARNTALLPRLKALAPRAQWLAFDALGPGSHAHLAELMAGQQWVVNAIGVIKQRIDPGSPASIERTMRVDLELPAVLGSIALREGGRVLQIATDCVFSGATGGYTEAAAHDTHETYGQIKSRGEVRAERVHHLRCSIVGRELGPPVSLLGWFLSQPRGAVVRGFVNHRWNGLSALHFARLAAAIIEGGVPLGHIQHLVPGDVMTKCDLLRLFARTFGREDIVIEPFATPTAIDRSLGTGEPEINAFLWTKAGFATPPSIEEMVREFAAWCETAGWPGRTS